MYPSKGNTPYGQQVYGSSQSYGLAGSGYSGNPVGSSDADLSSYRAYASQTAQYGGPYAAVYSSSAVTNVQQVGGVGSKEAVSTSNLQSRSTYQSALAESSKFPSGTLVSGLGITTDDYGSAAAHVYSQKGDQFSSVKNPDYVASDRRHYSEHQGAFAGRDSQNDSSRRYLESVSLNSRHQVELHNRMDQASLRQQQLMKAQQLQPGTNIRQDECYTPMSLPTHSQEISGYGARMDADPRGLSGFSAAYGGQVAASIIGGAPRRNVDDLMYVQGSSNAAYGVGLPPGRDYAAGKGILGTPRESNYQSSVLARSHPVLGVSMVDERNDDRHAYRRELEIREEERRRELLWEREKEREREERECERERERECERERERKRERERERERLQEHREKERERERRRALEARRERTPPRPIRDRRGSSLIKDKKAVRRATPHREAVHRHHSPVKEKKREYICKVYPFCLVDVERDHLSVSKRYPRLVIAADFSKAIVNWPRETLNLSLHTPVSFEHDFLDVEDKSVEKGPVSLQESSKSKGVKTVWNTKVILMSGISVEALQELCFGKDTDEKPVHVNNILKFAVMKKDRSFSAIGGPSHVSSDGDLQVDDFSLIQTAIRHVKHLTQLDLHSCHHWNRFLEIHYDRVGKDGFFSHKEVTVFYVPNISECLPSLDQWRGQWLTYKKEKTEREQVSKEKKPAEKKESGLGEKTQSKTVNNNSAGTLKSEDNLVKEDMADVKGNDQSKVDVGEPNKIPSEQNEKTLALDDTGRKDVVVVGGPSKISENLVTGGGSVDLSAEIKKTTKKKVVKKVVKGKVVSKKAIIVLAGSSIKQEENMDIEDGITEDKHGNADKEDKEDTISADLQRPATVTMTIVTKGTPGKSPLTEDKAYSSEALTAVKTKNEPTVMDGTEVVKNEHDGGSVAQDVEVKTTGKKKIIRRVIKRKIYTPKVKDAIANKNTEDTKEDVKSDLENKETVELNISENKTTEESSITNKKDHLNEKTVTDEKTKRETKSVDSDAVPEKRAENVNGSEIVKEKSSKKSGQDGKERKKDEKEKSKDGNQKSNKEKEKGGSLEPPKHPGLILKSHRSKGSKIRSVSLSLDGLLDYSDKDIEESSYELSLFAEAFNEMLQFEMGCRLLSFLEKLNKKYTLKRNSRKRQRDEKPEKVSEKEKSPIKRPKSNESPVAKEDTSNKDKGEAANIVSGSIKSGKEDASDKTDSENKDADGSSGGRDETKTEEKATDEDMIDEDEDPEEIIEEEEEEEEEADDDFRSDEVQKDDKADVKVEAESEVDVKMDVDSVVTNESNTDKIGNDKAANANEAADKTTKPANANEAVAEDNKQNADQTDTVKDKDSVKTVKEASTGDVVLDKELLEAFRYFDKNRTGYIKVQDLRCILHNLGKFMSNRHVKELAQSALLESNSARDDRVFYKKLVKMAIGDI